MPFDLQPHLVGTLIELRRLRADDFDALFAVASDPLIWEQHPESDRWTEPAFRRFFKGAMDSGGAFVVVDRPTGAVIGSTRFHDFNEAASEIEIGWSFLARSHWGGIYNAEMKRLMLEHAFRFVRNVVFRVGIDNIRSQRAVEKIGGRRVGMRPDARGIDSVLFRISRPMQPD